MNKTLDELVAGYATANDCPYTAEKGACQASLSVAGLDIQAGLLQSSGMLVLQTGVALLPVHGRAEFCLQLLTANNLFSQTTGFTLGVDLNLEMVTIQVNWELAALDAERFAQLVNNLLAVAADWMVRLHDWRPGENSTSDTGVESLNLQFLRV